MISALVIQILKSLLAIPAAMIRAQLRMVQVGFHETALPSAQLHQKKTSADHLRQMFQNPEPSTPVQAQPAACQSAQPEHHSVWTVSCPVHPLKPERACTAAPA